MKIWILTEEYNEYDQYGAYFTAAFKDKPTPEQLKIHTECTEEYNSWLIESGGGRQNTTDRSWYLLFEYEAE